VPRICTCVYICMYTYINDRHTAQRIYICIYICIYIYMHMYTHIYMHIYVHIWIWTRCPPYLYMHIYMHIYVCAYIYTYTQIWCYICMHIYFSYIDMEGTCVTGSVSSSAVSITDLSTLMSIYTETWNLSKNYLQISNLSTLIYL